jgi:hypothetical protein
MTHCVLQKSCSGRCQRPHPNPDKGYQEKNVRDVGVLSYGKMVD